MTNLERCDAEIALVRALPEDTPEAMGATIGECDWHAERYFIEQEESNA